MSNVLYVQNLEKQLAAALAACKVKDSALERIVEMSNCQGSCNQAEATLSLQPDDSALKAWLGEPVAWKDAQARNRIIFPPMKPEEGDDGWIPLYAPKGLK